MGTFWKVMIWLGLAKPVCRNCGMTLRGAVIHRPDLLHPGWCYIEKRS